jgi:hypothetical protein
MPNTLTSAQTDSIADVLKELQDIQFEAGTTVDLRTIAEERGIDLGDINDEQGNPLAWGISYDT